MDSNSSVTSSWTTITIHGFKKTIFHLTNVKEAQSKKTETEHMKLVDDLALVNFKFTEENDNVNLVYMLYEKVKCKENALIYIKVTCEDPKYCQELSCSTKRTRTLIFKATATSGHGNVHIFEIDIYLQAYQAPTLNKCEMFYNDQDFTDFCLVTNDGKVPVHRAFMVAHSEVFKAMLHGEWKETADGYIKIKGDQVTVQTLNYLKDYMYLAKLPDDDVELQTLLLIADRFMMHHLRDECIRALTSLVTADNFLDILEFATGNKFTKLTFAILLLTPEAVVCSAYNLVKDKLVGASQG